MHASPGEQLHRARLRRTARHAQLARRARAAAVAVLALGGLAACRPADDETAGGTRDTPGSERAAFDSTDVTILDTLVARNVVSQCSRPGPGPVSGYWMPTRAEVAEADAVVMRALAAVAMDSTGAATDTGVPRYVRQYAGLVRGDARVLYVNGVARTAIASQEDTAAWRRSAQSACDGGAMFFGAEYDPATGRVGALHFNGPG